MTRFLALLLALCTAAPALADDIFCEQPWFTRNLIFDRAGFCFSSPLGQALFDNSDCTGTDITLPERDRAGIDMILELEEYSLCDIDSSATTLEHLVQFEYLREMDVIPIPVEHESGCMGYLGPILPLRTGPSNSARVLEQELEPGMSIGFGSLAESGWEFVSIYPEDWDGGAIGHGWVNFHRDFPECEQYAG